VSDVTPWYIATERFGPHCGAAWEAYTAWSGLRQLDEVVSLDPMLCPTVLPMADDQRWPHIVNEDVMLDFFVDLEFLLARVSRLPAHNLLCVFRDPPEAPVPPRTPVIFDFVGYDLVDVQGSASALTNCGGFPDVFDNAELSSAGLLTSLDRAREVQARLRARYPLEPHADCHVWAIFRAARP
jgi:hypothetical protein